MGDYEIGLILSFVNLNGETLPYDIEKLLLAVVVGIQVLISIYIFFRIKRIEKTFVFKDRIVPYTYQAKSGIPELMIKNNSKILLNIANNINQYIRKNHSFSISFGEVKSIVDREIEVEDDSIGKIISLPLYLGLVATLIGIILGLWAIPLLDEEGFIAGINILIQGVKWAMAASCLGLICTTILSTVIYGNAKNKFQQSKNQFLHWLQVEVFPQFRNNQLQEIAGLENSIKQFTKDTECIVNQFGGLINKIAHLNVTKQTELNLQLADTLEKGLAKMDLLPTYLPQILNISQNLATTSQQVKDAGIFIKKVEESTDEIKQLTTLLTTYLNETHISGHTGSMAPEMLQQIVEKLNTYPPSSGINLKNIENLFEENNRMLKEIQEIPIEISVIEGEDTDKGQTSECPFQTKVMQLTAGELPPQKIGGIASDETKKDTKEIPSFSIISMFKSLLID